MKNSVLKLFLAFILLIISGVKAHAVQFDLLVLPTDIFSVCDNYFCFPEVSNIVAEDVIQNLNNNKDINVKTLSQLRQKLNSDYQLKQKTIKVIDAYAKNDKIDFNNLNDIAKNFGVKSVLLIDTYAINDKKYAKNISDTYGYYSAQNQTQALSQLEKIKQYSYDIISKNISQNVYMRFFPKDVRTFSIKKEKSDNSAPKYVPNALEHLSDPHIRKELDNNSNQKFRDFDLDDFVF